MRNFTEQNSLRPILITEDIELDKVQHHSFVVYHKSSSCGSDYIGETIRNTEIRCNKHNTRKIKILIVNHLNYNLVHDFWWFVLFCTSTNSMKGKILDVYYIKTWQPSLITQINSNLLNFLEIVLHRFISVLSLAYLFQFFSLFISILYIW